MKKLLAFAIFFISTLYADDNVFYRAPGPLLALSGTTQPKGTFSIQPYFYMTNTNIESPRFPDTYGKTLQIPIQYGISDFFDVRVSVQGMYTEKYGQKYLGPMDTMTAISFQVYKKNTAIRLMLFEMWPTGNYRNLKPHKLGIDGIGEGSFQTCIALFITQPFNKRFTMYGNFFYYAYSNVKVNGFNFYGGGYGTKGIVNPGNIIEGIITGELSISKRVALTCDIMYLYRLPTSFKGINGKNPDGTEASSSMPYKFQLSIAPGLEYSFTDSFGISGGAWFATHNRNCIDFMTGIIALYYSY